MPHPVSLQAAKQVEADASQNGVRNGSARNGELQSFGDTNGSHRDAKDAVEIEIKSILRNSSSERSSNTDRSREAARLTERKLTQATSAAPFRTPASELELFHGVKTVVEKLMYDPRYREEPKEYNRESWIRTVGSWNGRARLGLPFYLVNIECIVLVTCIHGLPGVFSSAFFESIRRLPSTPLKLMGAGLLFLVIFHTQTAYQKWAFARNAWNNLLTCCREIALQSCSYIKDFTLASRMCRYLIVYVISVRFWLRSEEIEGSLVQPILTPQGFAKIMACFQKEESADEDVFDDPNLSFQFKRTCAPLVCLEVLRKILQEAVDKKAIGPFHASIETNLKALGTSLAHCEKVLDTDIPFAYLAQVRTSVIIFLTIMPFFLVMELGWFTIICVMFFSYVAIGLENLSAEIETPFGYDKNDLPLDQYCSNIARDIRDVLQRRYASDEAKADEGETQAPPPPRELSKRTSKSRSFREGKDDLDIVDEDDGEEGGEDDGGDDGGGGV
eukprot:TRINITY_DN1770_c0_g1_i1.p1 TRINITY_DN1770_c0_g1~~TRINITY_DN1770_c0_g1_i1.p1  ORF type:complete len:502 (-),score=77.41 TRINITY_DN1770_c0_g1_i1:113-1618(-)